MNEIDNQQKRLMDISWLAGILEGEGCFTVQTRTIVPKRKGGMRMPSYTPLIQVTNTNELIIEKTQRIMKELGIGCYVYLQKQSGYRSCYRVVVLGLKKCQTFLNIMKPYIECRKPQADCLDAFIQARLQVVRGTPFGRTETIAIEQLKKLNRPYLFSETERLPLEMAKIQSELSGDIEAMQMAVAA